MKSDIHKVFPHLPPPLTEAIDAHAIQKFIPKETEILREGQYVKVIPLVLEGLIKVFTRYEEKELLLYYLKPSESCIMSFSSSLRNEPSKVFALTEEDTNALLLPAEKVAHWTEQFPSFNHLFFQLYNFRYSELLDTIHQVLFQKMDVRLYEYLVEKTRLTGKNPLKISHRQIANELGTAREVVSRTMKKLEHERKVSQHAGDIEILS